MKCIAALVSTSLLCVSFSLRKRRTVAEHAKPLPLVPSCNWFPGSAAEDNITGQWANAIEAESKLPSPGTSRLASTGRIYPGTLYAFNTLAHLGYYPPDKSTNLLSWECDICRASGFTLSQPRVSLGKFLWFGDAFAAYVAKIEPAANGTLDHIAMKSGCMITFRGSGARAGDWIHNLKFLPKPVRGCPDCMAHQGFTDVWLKMKEGIGDVLSDLGCKAKGQHIYLTGHSLGGAIATVAGFDLDYDLYQIGGVITYNAPRVGDANFAGTFAHRLRDALLYRVTYRGDVVQKLPLREWGFQHTDPEVYYETADLSKVKLCTETEDPSCSRKHIVPSIVDHCLVPYSRDCQICGVFDTKEFPPPV